MILHAKLDPIFKIKENHFYPAIKKRKKLEQMIKLFDKNLNSEKLILCQYYIYLYIMNCVILVVKKNI